MEGEHFALRTHEKMREVLLHPDATGPAAHYYMVRGGESVGNITVWEPGLVGGEYIKTYGHYHRDSLAETYRILLGEGVGLLQRLVEEKGKLDPARVEEFKAVRLKAGDVFDIPVGFGHLVANTGGTFLVTADQSPVDRTHKGEAAQPSHADYDLVKQMQGFAYYIIEHEGKPALIRNPRYVEVRKTDFGGFSVIGDPA